MFCLHRLQAQGKTPRLSVWELSLDDALDFWDFEARTERAASA